MGKRGMALPPSSSLFSLFFFSTLLLLLLLLFIILLVPTTLFIVESHNEASTTLYPLLISGRRHMNMRQSMERPKIPESPQVQEVVPKRLIKGDTNDHQHVLLKVKNNGLSMRLRGERRSLVATQPPKEEKEEDALAHPDYVCADVC